jgi:UPF0755 protein
MAKSTSKRRPAKSKSKKKGSTKRVIWAFVAVLFISLGISFAYFYTRVFSVNLVLESDRAEFLYIKSGDGFQDVVNSLTEGGWLQNQSSFVWLAGFMKYDKNVHPGRYRLKKQMSNRELVNLLRSGKQEPIRLTLRGIRKKEQLVSKISHVLEADSTELIYLLNNRDYLQQYGLKPATALCLFLPDTYEFYWNTTSEEFVERMAKEYQIYWDGTRKQRANDIGLSPVEVQIIASIVVQESNQRDEWPVIAGVYINRFKRGMLLQADPTVKYAVNDFDLRRVRSIHTSVDSPYNTYKYKGLPPGPIYMAGKQSMEAVLNYQRHNYLYFCARPDGSGYHSFARTFEEHQRNARSYQRNLNARGI